MEDSFKDPLGTASEFGSSFAFSILGNHRPLILNSDTQHEIYTVDQRRSATYDFSQYKKFFEPKFSEKDGLKESIFEFSNRIGSYVVYLLILAMNPISYPPSFSPKQNNLLAQKMVEKGITAVVSSLLWRFGDFLYERNRIPISKDFDSKVELIKRKLQFQFDEDFTLKLIDAFTWLYPLMSYEFERLLPVRYVFKEVLAGIHEVISRAAKKRRDL